jgi:hypothetical protein
VRDAPQTNIGHEGIETQKKTIDVRNKYHIKSVKKADINTARGREAVVLKKPQLSLSHKKYIIVHGNEDSTNNITTVQSTVGVAQGVVHTEGAIRTAVGGTRNTVGRIQTAVKSGLLVGSVKDVGSTFGNIGVGIKLGAVGVIKDSGRQLLKTQINKSETTDTGTEAIKQGLIELRCVDNARRAVYNTAKGSIKTVRSIKETPKAVKRDVRKIREKIIRKNRAKQAAKVRKTGKAVEAAKKGAGVIVKAVTSKGFIVVALGGILVLLCVTLVSGFTSIIISVIAGMFSWMIPGDGTNQYDYLQAYHAKVQEIQADIQDNIDSEYEYAPEYRYDGSEITSLNQYGNMTLAVDENAVIAAGAVKEFSAGNDNISNETIADVIEKFYSYSHSVEKGYCPDYDCMKDENTELTVANGDFYVSNTAYISSSNQYAVTFCGACYEHTSSVWTDLTAATSDGTITGSAYADVIGSAWEVTYNIDSDGFDNIDWNDITINTTTIYCNNSEHTIYYGEVVNFDAETGLANMGFTDDRQSMFWTYYGCLLQGGF